MCPLPGREEETQEAELGVEPVLRAGGVHGVRAAVCGQGKEKLTQKLLVSLHFCFGKWCWRSHKSRGKKLPEIGLVVNGESDGMQRR